MANFNVGIGNNTATAADVLSSSVVAATAEHFERTASTSTTTTTAFLLPSSSNATQMQTLESFVTAGTPHFVTSSLTGAAATHASAHHHHHHQQQHHSTQQHHSNSTSSSYTFVQIKREPCQVSEVTTSNNHCQQQAVISSSSTTAAAAAKTMSSSTLTTLVKIEASSPNKMQDMDRQQTAATTVASTNNSVPIGIAVARKRPQESTTATLNNAAAATTTTTIPLQQQPLSKDVNCFGIRVADLGGVNTPIYFTNNADFMTNTTTPEELALTAAGVQNVNRATWQYATGTLPLETLLSVSQVGLQYPREANRGQMVLMPATAATLGLSNIPLYTPTDPFQQPTAAAAFVWPSFIPQGTAAASAAAAAAAAAVQPPFIYPALNSHSTLSTAQPYATSLLFNSNYLAAAAANQPNQHNANNATAFNFGLLAPPPPPPTASLNGGSNNNGSSNSCSSSSTTSSSRFVSVSNSSGGVSELQKNIAAAKQLTTSMSMSLPLSMPLPMPLPQSSSLLLPHHSNGSMKIEEWTSAEFKAAQAQSQHYIATTPALAAGDSTFNYDKSCVSTPAAALTPLPHHNALELQGSFHMPTPPKSATSVEHNSSSNSNSNHNNQLQSLIQSANAAADQTSATNGTIALNLSNGMSMLAENLSTALNYKLTPPPLLCDAAATAAETSANNNSHVMTQMQDVNVQTDTPVTSEDENTSYALLQQQQQQQPLNCGAEVAVAGSKMCYNMEMTATEYDEQQPLELTKHSSSHVHSSNQQNTSENAAEQQQQQEQQQQAVEQCHNELTAEQQQSVETTTPQSAHESAISDNPQTENLDGLELLSLYSSRQLKHNGMLRIKKEPVEQVEHLAAAATTVIPAAAAPVVDTILQTPMLDAVPTLPAGTQEIESLGGLNLLCALAEQLSSGQQQLEQQNQAEHATETAMSSTNETAPTTATAIAAEQQHISTTAISFNSFQLPKKTNHSNLMDSQFPSMQGIELPCTSSSTSNSNHMQTLLLKRKKHKHSKQTTISCSSSSSASKKSTSSNSTGSGSSSQQQQQRCSKKSNKRKHKHKLAFTAEDLSNDEQIKEELHSALNNINPHEGNVSAERIFQMIDSNMRMRLADISRQVRKKKRKLAEIKQKKKNKKVKHQQQQEQLQLQQQTAVAAINCLSLSSVGSNASATLCDYKFSTKFASSKTATAVVNGGSSYLAPSSFSSSFTSSHAQFPPPTNDSMQDSNDNSNSCAGSTITATAIATTTSTLLKPVRLEPSTLTSTADSRSCGALRIAPKRRSPDKTNASTLLCKEPKLLTRHNSDNEEQQQQQSTNDAIISLTQRINSAMDHLLKLNTEHLFRKDTRVLTGMGGLFYAGVLDPLQPPDVFGVKLDGERGNKPHIMSREDLLKDTILEIAPKTVAEVPVGTRLCAYWSQHYRCFYPGRAIESSSEDDDSSAAAAATAGCHTGSSSNNIKRDFVSVEFDDGDSGRIRLQNIRFLLSDYPIAEYNDNTLYSLGKHKKNIKSSSTAAAQHAVGSTIDATQAEQQHFLFAACSNNNNNNNNNNNKNTYPDAAAADGSTNAQYNGSSSSSKKKKKKALTLLASVNNNNHATKAGTGTGTDILTAEEADAAAAARKHHKHKKHKKHKKHHHRKMLLAAASNANAQNDAITAAAAAVNGKQEPTEATTMLIDDESDVKLAAQTQVLALKKPRKTKVKKAAAKAAAAAVVAAQAAEQKCNEAAAAMLVKTERFDMEEETTSNMMSEISDEAKGEELGHNNSKVSKIAAFLPERQLWNWLGTAYRKAGSKGRARKQFYKSIKRGKETITVGDCAVFLSSGRVDRPYIGRIESMWETTTMNKVVRIKWFYHPEETIACPELKYPGALFESPHDDENDVQTISHRCEVLPFANYVHKFGPDVKQYQSIYDNNDTYYLAGYYNPRLQVLKLEENIPTLTLTLEEQQTQQKST